MTKRTKQTPPLVYAHGQLSNAPSVWATKAEYEAGWTDDDGTHHGERYFPRLFSWRSEGATRRSLVYTVGAWTFETETHVLALLVDRYRAQASETVAR